MLLSENQKTLSEFFTPSLKHPSHFDHFGQKDDSHNLSISEITDCKLQKTWLEKCLKSHVSKHRTTVNMFKGPRHC